MVSSVQRTGVDKIVSDLSMWRDQLRRSAVSGSPSSEIPWRIDRTITSDRRWTSHEAVWLRIASFVPGILQMMASDLSLDERSIGKCHQ
jgi:hypothetical protein